MLFRICIIKCCQNENLAYNTQTLRFCGLSDQVCDIPWSPAKTVFDFSFSVSTIQTILTFTAYFAAYLLLLPLKDKEQN